MLKIEEEPPTPTPPSGNALLALGFRPFFLAAGVSAVILLLAWIALWGGHLDPNGYYGLVGWHSHEMLFGYTAAVIAGFLLTAVRNWTGVLTASNSKLLGLVLVWLAGRIAPALAGIAPSWLIAGIDLLFLPLLALTLYPPLWQGKQRINRIFVPLLLLMAIANLYVHLEALGLAGTAHQGIEAMLFLVMALITLLGGRVIPFFTEAMVRGYQARRSQRLEIISIALIAALVLMQLTIAPKILSAAVTAGVAATQLLRFLGWYHAEAWRHPMLWVLYSAMIWIITGFLLLALHSLGLLGDSLAIHALTVGGIGNLTLGMMARVALGHTGRQIEAKPSITAAFLLLNLGALIRVLLPLLLPAHYNLWIHLSGGIWILAFAIFSVIYLPILLRPRIDGQPG